MKNKYHYFGEFGYFNLTILGGLAWYFTQNKEEKIEVCTYPSYGLLLKHLFPKNIVVSHIKWNFNEKFRLGEGYWDDNFFKLLNKKDFHKNIIQLFIQKNNWVSTAGRRFNWICGILSKDKTTRYFYLKTPLRYGKQHKSKKYISVFPRLRTIDMKRNVSKELWLNILETLNKNYPQYHIVIHGSDFEFLKFDKLKVIYPKNILEQIYYFNNSIVCISTNSGVAHFANNCNCDLVVLDKSYWEFTSFNPFKNHIKVLDKESFNLVSKLKYYLDFLLRTSNQTNYPKKYRDCIWTNSLKLKRVIGLCLWRVFPYFMKKLLQSEKDSEENLWLLRQQILEKYL